MVLIQAARVAGEIFCWSELQRVHKHADQHPAALLPGPANQGGMALMQGPHGGNQMQRARIASSQPLPQFRWGLKLQRSNQRRGAPTAAPRV